MKKCYITNIPYLELNTNRKLYNDSKNTDFSISNNKFRIFPTITLVKLLLGCR